MAHYDHNSWLAEQEQIVGYQPPPIDVNGVIVQEDSGLLHHHVATGGKQDDNAVLIALGTQIKTKLLAVMTMPITIGIVGLIWWGGIITFTALAFFLTVITIWGTISVVGYIVIVRADNKNSYYGTEQKRIDAQLTATMHQQDSKERVVMEALRVHERTLLAGDGQRRKLLK